MRFFQVWEHVMRHRVALFYSPESDPICESRLRDMANDTMVLYDAAVLRLLAGPAIVLNRRIVVYAHHYREIPNSSELIVIRLQ